MVKFLKGLFLAALACAASVALADVTGIVTPPGGTGGGSGTVGPSTPTTFPANSVISSNGSSLLASPQFVTCTNGASGAADAALLQTAATNGGNITLQSNCTLNATINLASHTVFNGNGYAITGAAASNWSGSAVSHFLATTSSVDVTVENTYFVCPATATGSMHILHFAGGSVIRVLNNNFNANNACGDAEAMIGVLDAKILGNTATGVSNACWDNWNGTQNVEIGGNLCTTGTATTAIYGILWTGFNTNDTAGTLTEYANIHDNKFYLNNQATFGDVGIYLQGYSSCTGAAADYVDVHDNEIFVATGIWAQGIRSDGCSNHNKIHDNKVYSDGTTSSVPAIEAKATTADIHIDYNEAYNFSAPTTGSDAGVFNNESSTGTLIQNTCVGGSCSAPLYSGQIAGVLAQSPFTGPYNKAQWGVISGIMSTSVVGTNGAYSTATAQPFVFSPGFWGYYPAGYICATGQAAGIYWTVPSSTTAGTIYNVVLSAGTLPYVPTSPTAFSCAAGTGVQSAASLTPLVTIAVPGNSLGANGSLYYKSLGARTNNGDTIIQEVTFGGQDIGLANVGAVNWYGIERTMQNTGVPSSQIVMGAVTTAGSDAVLGANGTGSFGVGTANSQNLIFNCQVNTATDWCFIYGARVEINYSP